MKKQLIDQSAHFSCAYAALFIAWLLGATFTPLAGATIGFAFGLIREISESDPIDSPFDALDILFWTLGGAAAGALL
jgi:hypothetical protein